MDKKKLLFRVSGKDPKQCKWEYFTASGKGGQKRNRCKSAARVTHLPSGAIGQAVESRSQVKNRQVAFKRMAESEKFKNWHKIECARILGEEPVGNIVEREMKNVRIEYRNEKGKWKEHKEDKK